MRALLLPTVMVCCACAIFASTFEDLFENDPLNAFLYVARTGEVYNRAIISEHALDILHDDSGTGRTPAWACWVTGIPLETSLDPVLIEFGLETVIPALGEVEGNDELARGVLMRPLHYVSEQLEPEKTKELAGLVVLGWGHFTSPTRVLALQVLGKLELDITDELPTEELRRAGTAPYFRYLAELGIEDEISLQSEMSLLSRLYAARCTHPDLLAGYLDDPLWAVRFAAAGRAANDDLVSLLEDGVAYVRLTAALRLADEGSQDARELLREMTAIPGPVGHQATAGLTELDEDLLRELLVSPEKGKRLAALDAWNESSLTFSRTMVETLAEDEYWLVPLFLAWFLEDDGEHDLALLVYETVREDPARYDNVRELMPELEVLLGIIDGYELEPTELPFSPDSVHVPDTLVLITDSCELRILLWKDIAPVTCANFVYLAESGFYDGIRFHRVIPGFVAQAGCPDGNGMGGSGYTIPNERNLEPYRRGVLGMADAGLNTAGSQFFIMLDDHNRLDGRYTAFGELVDDEGLDDITVGTLIEHIRL